MISSLQPDYTSVMLWHWRIGLLLTLPLYGQGTGPKSAAADYPAHAKTGLISIGAENMGRNIASPARSLVSDDYLVIDVALYSEGNRPFTLSDGQFALRVNGKKTWLAPQSPAMVASSLKYPDWETRPQLIGGVESGNGEILVGRPASVGRFPGDPRIGQRVPQAPRAPDPPDRSGVDKISPATPEEVVNRSALPEGEVHPPVSGYLFFYYKGKLKSIKSLELRYEGPAGAVSLLLP
jgi:hypothetical protein